MTAPNVWWSPAIAASGRVGLVIEATDEQIANVEPFPGGPLPADAVRLVPATPVSSGRPHVAAPIDLLVSLVDGDACWFDHHGGCQAHGYLSLRPGEICPQAELKALLAAASPDNTQET